MIRRLLSLVYGVLFFWVGYMLMCQSVFSLSPTDMVLGCAAGVEAFYRALIAAGTPLLAMIVLFSRIPLAKRAWANIGCAAGAALILLMCAVFLGAGASPDPVALFVV